jgi:hypothetical protein
MMVGMNDDFMCLPGIDLTLWLRLVLAALLAIGLGVLALS